MRNRVKVGFQLFVFSGYLQGVHDHNCHFLRLYLSKKPRIYSLLLKFLAYNYEAKSFRTLISKFISKIKKAITPHTLPNKKKHCFTQFFNVPKGQSGMYGHCHLNGNNKVETASATAVSVSGLNECINIFCSVSANNKTCKQFSAPKLINNCLNPAPLRGNGNSSGCVNIIRSEL